MKTEIDLLHEKVTEACKQLNKAKVKETEMANQLQDQAQKVQALFTFLCYKPHPQNKLLHEKCCVMQWRLH